MSLRISNLALAGLLLAGCGTQAPAAEGETVECAIGAGAEFSPVCTLELTAVDEFVIHHPDGGFRRFRLDDQGLVELADGAEQFVIGTFTGEQPVMVELGAGQDRYRLEEADLPDIPDD